MDLSSHIIFSFEGEGCSLVFAGYKGKHAKFQKAFKFFIFEELVTAKFDSTSTETFMKFFTRLKLQT